MNMHGWGLSILLGTLAFPGVVCAQRDDDQLARAHFETAVAYYERGRYEQAAAQFMEAYALSPRPELLDNAARAYERALMLDEAEAVLGQLLAVQPEEQEAIQERLDVLAQARARIRGLSPGAEEVELEPSLPPPAPTPAGGGGELGPLGIGLIVAGGALGIAALATGIPGHLIHEDLSASCPMNVCPSSREGDIETSEALVVSSTVFTFVAPVLGGVGVLLWVLDLSGHENSEADLRVVPGPTPAGLGLMGVF